MSDETDPRPEPGPPEDLPTARLGPEAEPTVQARQTGAGDPLRGVRALGPYAVVDLLGASRRTGPSELT